MCTGITSFNQPDGWISVKEGLPDDARFVLVYVKAKKQTGYAFAWFNNNKKHWFGFQPLFSSDLKIGRVIYWRELPDPPELDEHCQRCALAQIKEVTLK